MAYVAIIIVTLFVVTNLPRILAGAHEVTNTHLIIHCIENKYVALPEFRAEIQTPAGCGTLAWALGLVPVNKQLCFRFRYFSISAISNQNKAKQHRKPESFRLKLTICPKTNHFLLKQVLVHLHELFTFQSSLRSVHGFLQAGLHRPHAHGAELVR